MSGKEQRIVIFWFRRDLRIEDNTGLFHALRSGFPVLPVFIFDTDILEKLQDRTDARVTFIHQTLGEINTVFEKEFGARLDVRHGRPIEIFRNLINEFPVQAVYANEDYEPYAIKRDTEVAEFLEHHHVEFHCSKDQVIFAREDVLKSDGSPYTVYTPYSKQWLKHYHEYRDPDQQISQETGSFVQGVGARMPTLEALGFQKSDIEFPDRMVGGALMRHYQERRNFPAIDGTSRIGMHLRFGTVSIRQLARQAQKHSLTFLGELIWREFFMQILYHFPHVETQSFKPQYDQILWRNDENEFAAWCRGETGYPMVDAGMRELNATGHMHNRVRMVVASFLTKDLLIDWRWGEAYFAEKLLDYELASNNGNWQWAAGTGCDAAPYFRIFNPTEQARKFDPDGRYVTRWVPEYGTPAYCQPIVDHKMARERTLKVYGKAVKSMQSQS